MPSRQESRSIDTKRAILTAAGLLFARNGYQEVTMREIAKEAGCSHTTIYIYFKDKEALLHELSQGPLEALKQQMEAELVNKGLSPEDRLKSMGKKFIFFCLVNRTMFNLFFHAKASRVDEEDPGLEIQKLRNQLFATLGSALKKCMQEGVEDDALLACSRVYFFLLHGIIGSYISSEESADELIGRLESTFDLGMEVLIAGLKEKFAVHGRE